MIVADIAKAYEAGRVTARSFTKNISTATSAGVCLDLSMSTGNPAAQYYVGSIATATALAYSTDGGLNHGSNVPDGFKKYLHRMRFMIPGAAIPMAIDVFDYLAFYPFVSMDAGIQALTTGISIPRYSAADGIQMMLIEQNPYVGGAQVQITYTNSQGVSGRVTPVITLNSVTSIASVATCAPNQVGATGTFVSLAQGDYGVSYPESIEFLTGDTGIVCLVLVKPIASFAVYDQTVPSDWDTWNYLGYLPEIKNDAYLNMVIRPAGNITGTSIFGDLFTIWSPTS